MSVKSSEAVNSGTCAVEAAGVLLRGLIDYAGLFPPAALNMATAMANYKKYSESEYNWILGRFILPVTRLDELRQSLNEASSVPPAARKSDRYGADCLPLSVLSGADISADLARIHEVNTLPEQRARKVEIQSLEVKADSPEEIERLSRLIPSELETYFEIPLTGCERDCIRAVAACGRRAKIRTGGETAAKFPAPASVIEFIRLCEASNVPFKATAGLHHPLRSVHPFTYQPDSEAGMMHGFLNLFLAAAFLRVGMERSLAMELLTEDTAKALHFDSDGVQWREYRLSLRDIAESRKDFSISFGSCSFIEPVDDLRSLHLL